MQLPKAEPCRLIDPALMFSVPGRICSSDGRCGGSDAGASPATSVSASARAEVTCSMAMGFIGQVESHQSGRGEVHCPVLNLAMYECVYPQP